MKSVLRCWLLLSLASTLACSETTSEPEPAAVAPVRVEVVAEAPSQEAAVPQTGEASDPPRGLQTNLPGATDGYVMFSPLLSGKTYLVDNEGRVVHMWTTPYSPGGGQYLLQNGNLLRPGRDPEALGFRAGGVGGWIQELDWDGNVVWEWRLSDDARVLHHDVELMPNGNLLALAWETRSPEEARAAGRREEGIAKIGVWPDWILEIERAGSGGARIVWEWHAWDHLVQSQDTQLENHGEPAEHPGRIDINAGAAFVSIDADELSELKALGYVPDDADAEDIKADFLHINSIDYNATLDQIALSVPTLGELWIIDHGSTSEEASGSTGGRAGHGGDLLYRWGNPATYGRGAPEDKQLFFHHDVRWINEEADPGRRISVFNNGQGRLDGDYSSVDVIEPPIDAEGGYRLDEGEAFGPSGPFESYRDQERFYSPFISGAHRLANGNTMICQGTSGRLFEVTPDGRVVWDYLVPFGGSIRNKDGSMPQPGLDESPHAVFRATRVPADHPGLAGRTLQPLDPQPPWHADQHAAHLASRSLGSRVGGSAP